MRRTAAQIDALDQVIVDVLTVDNPMTVRGVFYRVMSAGAVPKTEKAYRTVQRRVLALRRAGEIPYSHISDGTRWCRKPESWTDVDQMLDDAASSYRRAMWHDQTHHIEVWSEKDAISGVVYPITSDWDVPLMVARGFSSETFLWNSAAEITRIGKPAVIYQLGDHDPSGVAAWEHIKKTLTGMAPTVDFTFERIAVTEQQIVDLQLPMRPTKATDTRSTSFAGESVEVDAIPSSVLRELVKDAITGWIDPEQLRLTEMVEAQERLVLKQLVGGAR